MTTTYSPLAGMRPFSSHPIMPYSAMNATTTSATAAAAAGAIPPDVRSRAASMFASVDVCENLCARSCMLEMQDAPRNSIEGMLRCLISVCFFTNITVNDTDLLVAQRHVFLKDNSTLLNPKETRLCNRNDAVLLSHGIPAKYAVPINGYASPLLILLTVINNLLVCIVLFKPHMRSPTNAILVAMAISDMFTGIFPAPMFIHFFASDRFYEYMPYDWCFVYQIFSEFIPTIFHTASIWLTMALAIQRYIYVCHSFKARTWCTIDNVITGTVVIYIFATLSQISRFFVEYPMETVRTSILNPNKTVSACILKYRPWVQDYVDVYFSIYYWFRVVFIHLIPCVSLVVMNALLIYAMRMAQQRRMQLLRQNKKSESRKLKESNCTTLMLVAVVGLFLLVEFPLGLLMVFVILKQTFSIIIIDSELTAILSLFSNFVILLSYPLNFFIYCGMSKMFRETFKRLFTGAAMPMEREYSQYMTLPTENGKKDQKKDSTAKMPATLTSLS